MSYLVEAIGIALKMLFSADPTVLEIATRTMLIALASTAIASLIFVPLACLIHFNTFPGKRLLIGFIQTMYSVPTVFIGMMVFLLVSRSGPLGSMGLLFSPGAIIIGEVFLIGPIILGLAISALQNTGKALEETALALGATRFTMMLKVLSEAKYSVLTSILMGFGRAVSEVGVAIMVGGNISGYTRTLTTSIALGIGKGETAISIALGLVLLLLAMLVSLLVNFIQHSEKK